MFCVDIANTNDTSRLLPLKRSLLTREKSDLFCGGIFSSDVVYTISCSC